MWCKCVNKGWSVIACSSLTVCSSWKIMCVCLMCIKQAWFLKMTSAKVVPISLNGHWLLREYQQSTGEHYLTLSSVSYTSSGQSSHLRKISCVKYIWLIIAELSFAERDWTDFRIDLLKVGRLGVKLFVLCTNCSPLLWNYWLLAHQ